MGKPTDDFVKKQMSHREISLALIEQGQAKAPATKEEQHAEWSRLQTAGDQDWIKARLKQLSEQPEPVSVTQIFMVLSMFEWEQVKHLTEDPAYWTPSLRDAERRYWRQAGKKPQW